MGAIQASEHDMIGNVTTVARMQRYGNYAVAIRLAEAVASAKANDSTSPPHSGSPSRSAKPKPAQLDFGYRRAADFTQHGR